MSKMPANKIREILVLKALHRRGTDTVCRKEIYVFFFFFSSFSIKLIFSFDRSYLLTKILACFFFLKSRKKIILPEIFRPKLIVGRAPS